MTEDQKTYYKYIYSVFEALMWPYVLFLAALHTFKKDNELDAMLKTLEKISNPSLPQQSPTHPSINRRAQHDSRFAGYRPPNYNTIPKYQKIQEHVKALADLIYDECPESVEKSKALTDLFSVRMWANAAVAMHTPAPAPKHPVDLER